MPRISRYNFAGGGIHRHFGKSRESLRNARKVSLILHCSSRLQYYVDAYSAHSPETLGWRSGTRHSPEGYIVSNQMRRNVFVSKTWASCCTSLNSMLKNVVNAVSAQGRAASIGEGCRCAISYVGIQFLKPCSQGAACRGPQRNRSLFSPLAFALHKALGSKVNLSLLEAGHLRHTAPVL